MLKKRAIRTFWLALKAALIGALSYLARKIVDRIFD